MTTTIRLTEVIECETTDRPDPAAECSLAVIEHPWQDSPRIVGFYATEREAKDAAASHRMDFLRANRDGYGYTWEVAVVYRDPVTGEWGDPCVIG